MDIKEKILECLNSAFQADPSGMHSLIINRLPTTQEMIDHPSVMVWMDVFEKPYLGLIGVLNGICHSLDLPALEFCWDSDTNKPIGFKFKE